MNLWPVGTLFDWFAVHTQQTSQKVRKKVFNWSDVHLYLSNFLQLRDGNFACEIHPAAQSAIGEQQLVTGFHCVWSVAGWLIVYQLSILSLSCSQYSHCQTICLRGWDDNACLGVRNTCSIGAWPNSLDRIPPWYCTVSPLLQTRIKFLLQFSNSNLHQERLRFFFF